MELFFETICVANGEIQNVTLHQERMNRTMAAWGKEGQHIDVASALTPEILAPAYATASAPLKDRKEVSVPVPTGRWKCKIVYGEHVESIQLTPYQMRNVSTLQLVKKDEIDYSFKSVNRNLLNALYEERGEADEILIVRNGLITDTSIHNVALFDGKQWHTPAHPLLRGTRREQLLQEKLIVEKDIRVEDLPLYTEIRLFNAMIPWGTLAVSMGKVHLL